MKTNKDKTIIVIPEATESEMDRFLDVWNNHPEKETIMLNKDVKMFKLIKGELFEVVTSLSKVVKKRIKELMGDLK